MHHVGGALFYELFVDSNWTFLAIAPSVLYTLTNETNWSNFPIPQEFVVFLVVVAIVVAIISSNS
jgi:hypothetical protein